MQPSGRPGGDPDGPAAGVNPGQTGPVPVAVAMWQSVHRVMRAFDAQLSEQGASWQVWHILLALHQGTPATQRELAHAVGIREATLTHHLRGMEDKGLIVRSRQETNRRVQRIEVTADGEALFRRLKSAAIEFDRALRAAIGDGEAGVGAFFATLGRLADVVPDAGRDRLPEGWPGNRQGRGRE